MKHGTAYAKRLKRVYARMKKESVAPEMDAPTDPLEQLVLAVLSQDTAAANARRALAKLLTVMVDINEVRVSSPREIAEIVDPHIPHSRTCAIRLCSILNAVFNLESTMSLDSLRSMGKRDAKRRLEELNGTEPYHVASVMLWSLGGHAIPVSSKLLAALRKDGLVDPDARVTEVQSFFERHIPPAEAKRFCLTMAGFSPSKPAHASRASTAKKPAKKAKARKKPRSAKTARRKRAAREG